MVLSAAHRELFQRWLPVMLIVLCLVLAVRGLSRMFWSAFGLFWMFYGIATSFCYLT